MAAQLQCAAPLRRRDSFGGCAASLVGATCTTRRGRMGPRLFSRETCMNFISIGDVLINLDRVTTIDRDVVTEGVRRKMVVRITGDGLPEPLVIETAEADRIATLLR